MQKPHEEKDKDSSAEDSSTEKPVEKPAQAEKKTTAEQSPQKSEGDKA